MSNICAVPLCESVRGKSKLISFHEFPSRIEVRELWLKNIKRVLEKGSLKPWTPEERSYVCSLHFEDSAYHAGCKRKILKKFATPTVFNNFPAYLQSSITGTAANKRKPPSAREIPSKKLKIIDKDIPSGEDNELRLSVAYNQPDYTEPIQPAFESIERPEKFELPRKSSTWGINVSLRKVTKKMKTYSKQVARLKATVRQLRTENSELKKNYGNDALFKKATQVQRDSENGITRAAILCEQLASYGRNWQKWSEKMIRACILFRSKSPRAYEFVRRAGMLKLPCNSTLKRYLGPTSMDLGFTDLIRSRLVEQLSHITPVETYTSLIFDEMAIRPRQIHLRNKGRLFGEVNYGGLVNHKSATLANRLLCFVLKGLSTNLEIPVSYFLVKNLTGNQLLVFIKYIVKELESIGFRIVRLVADDLSVNQRVFRELSGGDQIEPMIPHFVKPSRPLFLSFDYCHVIKNIRNNFLSRDLKIGGKKINKDLIFKLYEQQNKTTLKLTRTLTRKMVYPTTFEKMNVDRAVRLFSTDVASSLQFMHNTGAEGFTEVEPTIKFLDIMRKWFELHDVSGTSQHIRRNNENNAHYWKSDDDRLTWLETDFISYLDDWKASTIPLPTNSKLKRVYQKHKTTAQPKKAVNRKSVCAAATKAKPYLTKATETALRITTRSTVLCTRYLLKIGFNFVLSRKFSSDAVESLFAGIRQMGGCNDQCDAVSVVSSLEKILKTGIVSQSMESNVRSPPLIDIFGGKENTLRCAADPAQLSVSEGEENDSEYSNFLAISANILASPPEIGDINIEVAGTTMVAAFLCRNVKDKFFCREGANIITSLDTGSSIYEFIRLQDRGGLIYPTVELIRLTRSIFKLLDDFLFTFRTWKNCNQKLVEILTSPVSRSGILVCGCRDIGHSEQLVVHVLKQVVKIYLQNVANKESNAEDFKPATQKKPSCRKVLKLS